MSTPRKHGFTIIQTYEDSGKSGLVLKHRHGLVKLLRDVLSGKVAFKAILVYDISRWGRFQDADESAYYEFICKNAGVPVHYCAEQFSNDETLASALLTAIKRSMAAEFSRELGVKVFNGKKRLVQLGSSSVPKRLEAFYASWESMPNAKGPGSS